MTLKLKEWIAKVSIAIDALNELGQVTSFSVAASANTDVSLPDATRALLVVCGAGNGKLIAIVNTTATGGSSNLIVARGSTSIGLTDGTNKITINNSTSSACRGMLIDFAAHSVT